MKLYFYKLMWCTLIVLDQITDTKTWFSRVFLLKFHFDVIDSQCFVFLSKNSSFSFHRFGEKWHILKLILNLTIHTHSHCSDIMTKERRKKKWKKKCQAHLFLPFEHPSIHPSIQPTNQTPSFISDCSFNYAHFYCTVKTKFAINELSSWTV